MVRVPPVDDGPVDPSADAGDVVLDVLRRLPAGRVLITAAAELPGVHVVGGAVRDILLGRAPRELDVVVDGDPGELIARLSRGGSGRQDASVVRHARFATASVAVDGGRIDVAGSRRERYTRPGALPDVEPAPLAEDLLRRDFTVNAIAASLPAGEIAAAPSALEDLAGRRLRVLHDESFRDDPTRLLRLARLRVRLGFAVESRTATLAARAGFAGVSGARIGAELRLGLAEPEPIAVLEAFAELRDLPLDVDRRVIGRACELLAGGARRADSTGPGEAGPGEVPGDGRVDLLLLAAATRLRGDPAWLAGLELTASERDVVLAAWNAGPLATKIVAAGSPRELSAVLAGQPPEAIALAGALGPAAAAGRWLRELRHVRLEIDGRDLIAAGIAPGPELGRRLERTLGRKLDGLLTAGGDVELADALSDPAPE